MSRSEASRGATEPRGELVPNVPTVGGAEVSGRPWPLWARLVVTGVLAFHLTAILAAVFGQAPASEIQMALASQFAGYYQLIDQGYSYRYYSPEPPPTPVVEATLSFESEGREEVVRFPDRRLKPRLLYQRHMNLGNAMYRDFMEAKNAEMMGAVREKPRVAKSVARHLLETTGCDKVTFRVRHHLVPPIEMVREGLNNPRVPRVDPEADEFYSAPELIGEFTWNDY